MKFEILNVEHGFCAYAIGEDGGVLLFDCGHSATIRPSRYLPQQGITTIRRLFVTNYDEDHISDLTDVRRNMHIEILSRNASMTSAQIRSTKTHPISLAMNELLGMIDSYTGYVQPHLLDPHGLRVSFFHNEYPTFTDTNNLSLLTFLDVGDISFVLGGDLEQTGWSRLIQNSKVRSLLGHVDVFVASHHGRENGYCREVFNYCHPSLIVMSDGPIRHNTQKMADTYAQHARGEHFNSGGSREFRKVVTTRKDGNIFWDL